MGGFSFPPGDNKIPAFVDRGQGASDRLASWGAWTADPNPLNGGGSTIIMREDNNGALQDGVTPLPLGQGGVGQWGPILDGSSTGATSGGDNPFLLVAPEIAQLTDDFGTFFTFDNGIPILGNV